MTCLNEKGQVYDETKYAWLQGRQVWTYCFLYQNHERFKREDMKAAAIKGGEFLLNHFKDQNSDKIYFMTSREGLPLKHQRTLFTEVFFCMAMSGLYQITKEKKYFIEATEMFQKIHQWARFDESGLGKLPNLPKVSTSERTKPLFRFWQNPNPNKKVSVKPKPKPKQKPKQKPKPKTCTKI